MSKGLLSRGFQVELEEARRWRAPPSLMDLYAASVERVHAWDEGALSTKELCETIISAAHTHPSWRALDAICGWLDRLIDVDPEFVSIDQEMSRSSLRALREYSAWRLKNIDGQQCRDRFERLLSDRSKAVRRAIVFQAESHRWAAALGSLRLRLSIEASVELQLILPQAINLIERGYRVSANGEGAPWVTYYSGGGAGGVGQVRSQLATRSTLRVLERLRKIDNEFLARHGHWPARPLLPHEDIETLSRWTPNVYGDMPN